MPAITAFRLFAFHYYCCFTPLDYRTYATPIFYHAYLMPTRYSLSFYYLTLVTLPFERYAYYLRFCACFKDTDSLLPPSLFTPSRHFFFSLFY